MPHVRPGVVSVVLVNFRGAADTVTAIEYLRSLDWPAERLEIVVVENASGDDSLVALRAAAPDVLVESPENLGFAGGCNFGVSASSGEYVAFLNNDARPDAGWVRAAVETFESSPTVGAVASKVMDWNNEVVDYIGSALTWFGMGYKPFEGHRVPFGKEVEADVLFGTGAAMFVRRTVYTELAGFDERFFMFFEDVDFGWRLNLLGHRFVYQPRSLAFHKHHASMSAFGSYKETYLLERNALFALYKNLGEHSLTKVLPAALTLAVRRGIAKGQLDSTGYDLRKGDDDSVELAEIPKTTVATFYAIDQFVDALPGLREARTVVQSTRKVTDGELGELFGRTDAPSFDGRAYLDGYERIVTEFDVLQQPTSTRVLIITGDPIGVKMAGPAIRAWNMAQALSGQNEVRLLTLTGHEDLDAPFELVHVRPGELRKFAQHEAWADVILFQGHALSAFPTLRDTTKVVIADIYDPMQLEQLEQARELAPALWAEQVAEATETLNDQLSVADFFICASERQRVFYLGQLSAMGRLNTANYADDPDFSKLIDVVPFGLERTEPVHERQVLKGVVPGIGVDDKVVLWSGGVYNWFDPRTLIRAMALLGERQPSVKLFFLGTQHPHPGVPVMAIIQESIDLATELGVLGKSVFFNTAWVEYGDRQNYLLEADAGVSTHFNHIETTFSFRTRILDYLWARLPIVTTVGDHFGDLVKTAGLGIAVEPQNPEQLAAALEAVLFDEKVRTAAITAVGRVREEYVWDRVLRPLTAFVGDPHKAPDRAAGATPVRRPARKRSYGLRHDLERTMHYLVNGGPRLVIDKVRTRFALRRQR